MLVETQTLLAKESAHLDLLERLVKYIESKRDHLPKTKAERRLHPEKVDDRLDEAVEHALRSLENGVSWDQGIAFPELEPLAGKPGLRVTRVKVARLEREVAELQAIEAKWPTPETKRRFKFVGKPDLFWWRDEERYLKPGEEVELNRPRATAYRDMFEAIE